MKESILNELKAGLIMSIFSTMFYFFCLRFNVSLFGFFSPVFFIFFHFNWTRKYKWYVVIFQIAITSYLFIVSYHNLIIHEIFAFFRSTNFEDIVKNIFRMMLIAPITYFFSFLLLVTGFKLLSDYILSKLRFEEDY